MKRHLTLYLRPVQLLDEDKEHAEMEELVCSLGTNADIMDSMLRSNVAARKAFEDKISRLRAKLVETAHRKRQRAESNASFFFGAFENDLDEFSKQVKVKQDTVKLFAEVLRRPPCPDTAD